MSVQHEIRNYIIDKILFGDAGRIDPDISFQESGILDSTGFLELIAFIEERFGINIADEELVPEHLDTLRKMSSFVERKLAGGTVMRSIVDSITANGVETGNGICAE